MNFIHLIIRFTIIFNLETKVSYLAVKILKNLSFTFTNFSKILHHPHYINSFHIII